MDRRLRVGSLLVLLAIVLRTSLEAGAYLFAGGDIPDAVAHPSGFDGTGPVVSVTVCVDPASANASSLRVPVRNVLATFNALQAASPNLVLGGANDIPSNAFDLQSVVTHELGHCIGLAHSNAATESGLPSGSRNYTKSEPGPDGEWDLDDGADNLKGSCDDLRSDDVNLHWFARATNNPFVLPSVVDSTTYSRELAQLPTSPAQCSGAGSGPHRFAANAERSIGVRLGFPATEAVMQQGSGIDEDQRRLAADDVATLRYAMTGLDELAGTGDDYVFQLLWGGLTTTGCDVSVRFDNATAFASCSVGGGFVGPGSNPHVAIGTGTVRINTGFNWYYDQDLRCSLDVDGDGQVEPLTDATLATRFLFGFTGDALTVGAIGPGAVRATPEAVIAYLGGCRFPLLDADGDGTSHALSDGILVVRYLFGFRGDALIGGAVAAGCTRCGAAEIEDLIGSFFPQA